MINSCNYSNITMYNISVIGNIGCGKSTLLTSLSDKQFDVVMNQCMNGNSFQNFTMI